MTDGDFVCLVFVAVIIIVMTPMDWFGVGYIIVSVIVIIIYLGLYFGWF